MEIELVLEMDNVAETVNGMRYDTFLVDSDILSEEILQPYRTEEEEEKIRKEIISVLNQKNRVTAE